MSNKVPMTPQGRETLETELKKLLQQERPQVIKDIEEARALGDLSENADYDAAKEKQAYIESRITALEDKIANSEVIDPSTIQSDTIVFGAYVHLLDLETKEETEYQILGEIEVDVKKGKISILSPLARALIGRKKGDMVEFMSPKGLKEYKIIDFYFR